MLQAVRERKPDLGYKLIHANKVFFDRTLPLNKCVTLLLNTELGAVDFGSGGGEKARKEINRLSTFAVYLYPMCCSQFETSTIDGFTIVLQMGRRENC